MMDTVQLWFVLTPITLTALGVILAITLRWFSHRERMALIGQGYSLPKKQPRSEQVKTMLAIGLPISLVGLAVTIGLLTLGIGPWLLLGLIPLFAGLALVLTSLVLKPAKEKKEYEEKADILQYVIQDAEEAPMAEQDGEPAVEPEEWVEDEIDKIGRAHV